MLKLLCIDLNDNNYKEVHIGKKLLCKGKLMNIMVFEQQLKLMETFKMLFNT